MKLNLFLFSVVFNGLSCSNPAFVSEGQVKLYLASGSLDANGPKWAIAMQNKMWFRDSCVIFENAVTHIGTDTSGKEVQTEYPSGYTFINLKEKVAQDYYNFRDTSKPYCSYRIDSVFMSAKAFRPASHFNTKKNAVQITDTVMNGTKYKRFRVVRSGTDDITHYTLFMSKPKYDSFFSLDPYLDQVHYPLRVTMLWMQLPNVEGYLEVGLKMMKHDLTEPEQGIFRSWESNILGSDSALQGETFSKSPCPLSRKQALDELSLMKKKTDPSKN